MTSELPLPEIPGRHLLLIRAAARKYQRVNAYPKASPTEKLYGERAYLGVLSLLAGGTRDQVDLWLQQAQDLYTLFTKQQLPIVEPLPLTPVQLFLKATGSLRISGRSSWGDVSNEDLAVRIIHDDPEIELMLTAAEQQIIQRQSQAS